MDSGSVRDPYNLKTERLLLRPVSESDAGALFACCRDPEVGINAGWKPHESLEETRALMEQVFLGQESVWAIVLADSGRLIGTGGLIPDPKRENGRARMLGYSLGKEYWGSGYMTEAVRAILRCGFELMDLELISAYCYPGNERSKRVIAKCGFQYEGTLVRAEERFDGAVMDNECYVLLREQYAGRET